MGHWGGFVDMLFYNVPCMFVRIQIIYVCAYGYVLRSRLTKEHQSVENTELMREHCSEFDVYILKGPDHK